MLDWITRRREFARWKRDGRSFYICHLAHENDRISAETQAEYFKWAGVPIKLLEFGQASQRPELQQCLNENTIAVVGYNYQLDHSCIGDEFFIDLAAKKNIPVIHWTFDHPSLRWPMFENRPRAPNVRYVFVSRFCEDYFRRYALPAARTGSATAPMNPRARVESLSPRSFRSREITCLIPLNLRRLGGIEQELEARIESLEPELRDIVREALEGARFDLVNPLVQHIESGLSRRRRYISNSLMHVCAGLVEDMTQIRRRRRIFEVAARFPAIIQTDLPPPELAAKGTAIFRTAPEWINPKSTLARFKSSRAVLSVSLTNDALHDRTANALNAGCVAIVEDNVIHRRLFKAGKNALFFRYEDDSLERCLELVCKDPERAYRIAKAGMRLRDKAAIRFSGCHNLIDLAVPQATGVADQTVSESGK